LKNLGLNNNQYIAYVHQNTKTTHIHIISNRINEQGKALNDSYIGFKAQASAEEIAKSYGYKTAKEIRVEKVNQFNSIPQNELKLEIYKAHNFSVKSSNNFQEYMQQMNSKGFQIEPVINKGGKLQGFKIVDKVQMKSFKASEIHKNCSLKVMQSKGIDFNNLNAQLKDRLSELKIPIPEKPIELVQSLPKKSPEAIQTIKNEIYNFHLNAAQSSSTFSDYMAKMAKNGFEIKPMINQNGKLYSFKIVALNHGLAFKSDEIHENCGLKSMLQNGMNFNELDKQLAPYLSKMGKQLPYKTIDLIGNLKPFLKVTKISIKLISKLVNGFDNELGY